MSVGGAPPVVPKRRQLELIARFYDEMWNRFDKSVMAQILDDGIVFRGSLGQQKVGIAGLAEYIDLVRAAFPDFHNEVVETITEDNRTFARLRYTGTHRGAIFGIPATGRPIDYAGAAVFTFGADRIVSVWVLGDLHGLLAQLRG